MSALEIVDAVVHIVGAVYVTRYFLQTLAARRGRGIARATED